MDIECLSLKHLTSPTGRKAETKEEDERNEHKENMFVESKKTTPHKFEPEQRGLFQEQVHITPHKEQESFHPDPLTPTANLKVLISAASPDIRDREMKKSLFRPLENEPEEPVVDVPFQSDDVEEFEKKPSRKQKSLGLLCQKFLALYPSYPPASQKIRISLDEVATHLGVERRRIYDIVNVLESLKLVSRLAKNQYLWHGREKLGQTLQELHGLGRRHRYHLQLERTEEATVHLEMEEEEEEAMQSGEEATDGDAGFGAAGSRKDKSLRIMSQKFVMLFLLSRTQTVTLDQAAKILIEESQDLASNSKYKTKVRRLYDIANVLTSLNLISKVHVKDDRGRKPAFKWIGPNEPHARSGPVEALNFSEVHTSLGHVISKGGRQARHVSFNVVPISVSSQRVGNSAPSSPQQGTTTDPSFTREPVDLSRSNPGTCQMWPNSGARILQTVTPQVLMPKSSSPASPVLPNTPLSLLPLPRPQPSYSQSCGSHVTLTPPSNCEEAEPQQQQPLAFFGLPQAPVVMMYGGQGAAELVQSHQLHMSTSGDSSSLLGKRTRGEGGFVQAAKKCTSAQTKDEPLQEQSDEGISPGSDSASQSFSLPNPLSSSQPQSEAPPPAHYLYVPNPAGLNLLLPSGNIAGGFALSSSSIPTLAMPYVLLPSSALPYQLITSSLPASSLPVAVPPTHLVLPPSSYANATPASPVSISGSASPGSPGLLRKSSQTPLTPKETEQAGTEAFFQTPGTMDSTLTKPTRQRGSVQRRLDVGHGGTN